MTNMQASFPTLGSQVVALNNNVVEILSKINSLMTTNEDVIDFNLYDDSGTISKFSLPSFKSLKNDIERLNNNINTLYGIDTDGSLIETANNKYKKIITVDLNKEPTTVGSLGAITTFKAKNNYFFENLMSPMINIELDLSDKIEDNVHKILSRRYIIDFEKDEEGNYTEDAQNAITDFNSKFRNNSNINIIDLENWHSITKGIKNPGAPQYDEDTFDITPNNLLYDGVFSVLKIEEDRINQKLWYVLNTLNYLVRDTGTTAQLAIGSEVIINSDQTSTRYKIVEISTVDINPKVRFERVEGIEPISVGIDTLKIYSPIIYSKKVQISIGFNEYDVIFIKPYNTENNLIAKSWSLGTGFMTSDLIMLSNDELNGITLNKFYTDYVYDYGRAVKDLVAQKIPISLGEKPQPPTLNPDNFKVVQINKHLTDSVDLNELKQKKNNQSATKLDIQQIDDALKLKNTRLTNSTLKAADIKRLNNEIKELTLKRSSLSTQLSSLTTDILNSAKTINTSKVEPKYRIRGFWSFPQAISTPNTTPQEVVQFKIRYRYLNKNGSENNVEIFKLSDTTSTTTTLERTQLQVSNSNSLTTNNLNATLTNKATTAAFSNWVEFKTDARIRTYDKETNTYKWEISDVEDADTPNINQLDISISPNEKVEIMIKSLSEVGYPEAPIESEWSDVLTIEFPDNLENILDSSEAILQEATADEMVIRMNNELSSKGIDEHVNDTTIVDNYVYYHSSQRILSGFKDANGMMLGLFDYLKSLQDRIIALEEQINHVDGELQLVLMRGDEEFIINNDGTLEFNIECEDYLEKYNNKIRTYSNNIYVIKDFVLKIRNISQSAPLNILTSRTYRNNPSIYNTLVPQVFWVNNNDELLTSDITMQTLTQLDNQFIWCVNYDSVTNNTSTKLSANINNSFNKNKSNSLYNVLSTAEYNLGYSEISVLNFIGNNKSLLDTSKWIDNNESQAATTKLLSTIHPVVQSLTDLTDKNSKGVKSIDPGCEITIPINIYFKMNALDNNKDGIDNAYVTLANNTLTIKHIKKLKFYMELENDNKPIQFTLKFNLNRNKVIFPKLDTTRTLSVLQPLSTTPLKSTKVQSILPTGTRLNTLKLN